LQLNKRLLKIQSDKLLLFLEWLETGKVGQHPTFHIGIRIRRPRIVIFLRLLQLGSNTKIPTLQNQPSLPQASQRDAIETAGWTSQKVRSRSTSERRRRSSHFFLQTRSPKSEKSRKTLAITQETQSKITKANTQQGSNKTKSTRPRKGFRKKSEKRQKLYLDPKESKERKNKSCHEPIWVTQLSSIFTKSRQHWARVSSPHNQKKPQPFTHKPFNKLQELRKIKTSW